MDNFLTGRKQAFRVELPDPDLKKEGLEALEVSEYDEEQINENTEQAIVEETIEIAAPPKAVNPPKVEVLLREGIIQKIFITCDNGQYIELQCDYANVSEDIEAELVEESVDDMDTTESDS